MTGVHTPTSPAAPADQTDGAGLREAVARVIDPDAWDLFDTRPTYLPSGRLDSIAKADAILALTGNPSLHVSENGGGGEGEELVEGVAECPDCCGEGIIEHEGGDSTQSIVERETCQRCAGNGEIVVDWEVYLHGPTRFRGGRARARRKAGKRKARATPARSAMPPQLSVSPSSKSLMPSSFTIGCSRSTPMNRWQGAASNTRASR